MKRKLNESSFFVPTGTSPLSAGDSMCTRQFTPNCTLNDTATAKTCNDLANKWNISATNFVLYNDNVDDNCANLTTGQSVSGASALNEMPCTIRLTGPMPFGLFIISTASRSLDAIQVLRMGSVNNNERMLF